MVKIKKEDTTIQIRISKQLKTDAEKILTEKYNKSISEYLRDKLREVVENNDLNL